MLCSKTMPVVVAVAVASLSSTAVSALLFHFVELPVGWCLIAWCAPPAVMAIASTGVRRKAAMAACAFLIAIALAELTLDSLSIRQRLEHGVRYEGSYLEYFRHNDPITGYAPRPGAASAVKFVGTNEIYRVIYTINTNGLRLTPLATIQAPAVMFFGCSFVFGEGLNDSETLPWQTAVQCSGAFRTLNFGFHGYGPHQMLSSLESGWADRIASPPVRAAIYVGLLTHAIRAAGRTTWDLDGPRYTLDANGEPRRAGTFDSGWRSIRHLEVAARRAAGRSCLFKCWGEPNQSPTQSELELFAAIVTRSRNIFASSHPDSEFHVIYWDVALWNEDRQLAMKAADMLEKAGIQVHRISNILPDLSKNPLYYAIHPSDLHPNAEANRLLSQYIAREILKCSGTPSVALRTSTCSSSPR